MSERTQNDTSQMQAQLEQLRQQLYEANETIEAIRTGQIDALVVNDGTGHQLYTLKTADQAYRVFIENMAEGAVTLNKDGVIMYCNSKFARIISCPLSSVIGMAFEEFVPQNNKHLFQQQFISSWSGDSKEEMTLSCKGAEVPVQLSFTALQLNDGAALSVIITDLTAIKKVQEQLEDNNRQLAAMNKALEVSNHDLMQFASVASHDLQEPLRKVDIFSSLLLSKVGNSLEDEARVYIKKITGAIKRMKILITDVLNYSKLSEGGNEFQRIDLNEIAKETLDDFELAIKEKNAVITIGSLPVLDGNKGQIRQVFQNIFSNALKFSKPGQDARISVTSKKVAEKSFASQEAADGKYCIISIKDNGIGFDEKYLPNIFALFERLHTKDKYEGTGIGMAITKKIIEKHNGLINAISSVGNGAEFLILLPVHQPVNVY
ncbi:MAG TPA: ATP-binding protein [Flavipsychrobacter sp.]|nr:ATP-binding protein [Flavipsychrobacter sp.]